jgi:hypothetical protein
MNMDRCHLQKLNTRGNDIKLVIICVQMEQNSRVEQTSRKYNFPRIWSNRWGKKKHNTVAWLDLLYQTFLTKTHQRREERKQPFQCCYIYKPPATDINDKLDQREPNDTNNHTTAKKLHKNTCKVLPFDDHLRVWAPAWQWNSGLVLGDRTWVLNLTWVMFLCRMSLRGWTFLK